MAMKNTEIEFPLHSAPIRAYSGTISKDVDTRKRKNISSPEYLMTHCAKCEDKLKGEKMTCQNCNLKFCMRCSALNKKVVDLIISGELADFNFLCKNCKLTLPTISEISDKLTRIEDRQEARLRM